MTSPPAKRQAPRGALTIVLAEPLTRGLNPNPRSPAWISALLLPLMLACAELGPPATAPTGWVPEGTKPALQRVWLPLAADAAGQAKACYEQCRLQYRSPGSLSECLTGCPGVKLELNRTCPTSAVPPRSVCLERVVALDEERGEEDVVGEAIAVGLVVVLLLGGYVATSLLLEELCDSSSNPRCPDVPVPGEL